MIGDESGQLHTIEGFAAAMIIVVVLSIVVQTTSITPLSASFTNQHIKLELQNIGNDILTTLDETLTTNTTNPEVPSLLRQSVVDWCVFSYYDTFSWNNTSYVSLVNNNTPNLATPLSNTLKFALVDNGIAFNVEVSYTDVKGNIRTSKMIWNGDPSENSVTVSRFVVLHDGDDEMPDGTRFDSYYLHDISPTTSLHNVVEVRLTLWVM